MRCMLAAVSLCNDNVAPARRGLHRNTTTSITFLSMAAGTVVVEYTYDVLDKLTATISTTDLVRTQSRYKHFPRDCRTCLHDVYRLLTRKETGDGGAGAGAPHDHITHVQQLWAFEATASGLPREPWTHVLDPKCQIAPIAEEDRMWVWYTLKWLQCALRNTTATSLERSSHEQTARESALLQLLFMGTRWWATGFTSVCVENVADARVVRALYNHVAKGCSVPASIVTNACWSLCWSLSDLSAVKSRTKLPVRDSVSAEAARITYIQELVALLSDRYVHAYESDNKTISSIVGLSVAVAWCFPRETRKVSPAMLEWTLSQLVKTTTHASWLLSNSPKGQDQRARLLNVRHVLCIAIDSDTLLDEQKELVYSHTWDAIWRMLLAHDRHRPSHTRGSRLLDIVYWTIRKFVSFRRSAWTSMTSLTSPMIQAFAYAIAHGLVVTPHFIRRLRAVAAPGTWRDAIMTVPFKRVVNHVRSTRALLFDKKTALARDSVRLLDAWRRDDGVDALVATCIDMFPDEEVAALCEGMCQTAAWTARQAWIVACGLRARGYIIP